MLTRKLLNDALAACGYSEVSSSLGTIIVNQINDMTNNSNEVAMFLAQVIHESGGFVDREEWDKGAGQSYVPYYGRGFIQLTHDYNYRAASLAIFGDERLVDEPNMVFDDLELSMRVSIWFWETIVRPKGGPRNNNFGLTTDAINGALEKPGSELARRRYKLYIDIARVFGIQNLAKEY